jgi:hypothetical protein
MTLKPGWLQRQIENAAIETAMWTESMRKAGGFTDEELTADQRREAARRLRARADELDPPTEGTPCCS